MSTNTPEPASNNTQIAGEIAAEPALQNESRSATILQPQASASTRNSPQPRLLDITLPQRPASQPLQLQQSTLDIKNSSSIASRRFESQQRKLNSDSNISRSGTASHPLHVPSIPPSSASNIASGQSTVGNLSTIENQPMVAESAAMQNQAETASLQSDAMLQQEKQQQLMNFLTGYSVDPGSGIGNGSSFTGQQNGPNGIIGSNGSMYPGMGVGGFNFGMQGMLPGSAGPMSRPGAGVDGQPLRNDTTNQIYPRGLQSNPYDNNMGQMDLTGMGMAVGNPGWSGMGMQANTLTNLPRNGQSNLQPSFNQPIRSVQSSPVNTPMAPGRYSMPHGQNASNNNASSSGSPVPPYLNSPANTSYPNMQGQGMDYGSIAMRMNHPNRTGGSLAGMAPRPAVVQNLSSGGGSDNPTPVAPNWGHIGLPEPSPASTPLLGASSGVAASHMDWADSQGADRRRSDAQSSFGGPSDHRAGRGNRRARETLSKSGTATPVPMDLADHSIGGPSAPTSPQRHMSLPGGHHSGLMSGVENALADLNTGHHAGKPRKKTASASSSRVNSPDRKRKSVPVFSYSGALSALNSRAGSPTGETDPAKPGDMSSAFGHVDMNAVGQALRNENIPEPGPSEGTTAATGSFTTGPGPDVSNPAVKGDYRKRKRNRTIQSCLPCHQNKRKCDRKKPCSRCKALGLTGSCVYEVDHDRNENDPDQHENDHLRDRIAELEQVVRELRQKGGIKPTVLPEVNDHALHKKRKLGPDHVPKTEGLLKEGKLSASSSRRTSISEGQVHDPNRRTSMRTWGSGSRRSSPEHGEEPYLAHTLLSPGEALIGDSLGRQAYVGVPGGRNMLRRLADLTASHAHSRDLHEGHRGEPLESAAFIGFFPDQRKTFPFTTIWSHEHFSSEVVGILPSPAQARALWQSFEEEIARYFSAWHLPSLKTEFEAFFELSNDDQMMTTLGTLSVMLMICSLAVMVRASEKEIFGGLNDKSLDISDDDDDDLTCSRMQSELYLSGAYQALRLCSFMSSPTISTITSEIMMVIYLLNSERASDAWPELGIVIRQAVAMGLHIDPLQLYPDLPFKDAEVRRRVWWTIAGLDALLCLSLGRPSAITYYTTQLPQDRPDENFQDSAEFPADSSKSSETTSFTYHAAYFALTIPSLDILGRVFHQDRRYGRSVARGWFSPPEMDDVSEVTGNMGSFTYDDALRLDGDILAWYNLIPAGMRFDPDVDNAESLLRHRPQWQINQTLALCVKVQMIRLILHRPYLRVDPSAYTHSTDICFDASHAIMCAFKAMSGAKSSIAWSWWTMSLRAFHAGVSRLRPEIVQAAETDASKQTVCAFLAIRQPDGPIAVQCLEDIRGAITIFTGRLRTWLKAHPVQGHLCQGLVSLERLATTATRLSRQREDAAASADSNKDASAASQTGEGGSEFTMQSDSSTSSRDRPMSSGRYFNKSSIQAFPSLNSIPGSPGFVMDSHAVPKAGSSLALNVTGRLPEEVDPTPFQHVFPVTQRSAVMENAAGARGSVDAMGLPQFWADVFGLPMDEDKSDPNPLLAL